MNGDQYKEAIQALAGDAEMPSAAASRIERELLTAFAAHHGASAKLTRSSWQRGGWRRWLAAAAALGVTVGGIQVWRVSYLVTSDHITAAVQSSTRPPHERATADVTTPFVRPDATPALVRPAHAAQAVKPRPNPGVVKPAGFVEFPGAASLPAFESGEIVRMALPAASLPSYGLDIVSSTGDQPVEADVLIGQDGQPRGIRLVINRIRSVQ